MGLLSNFKAAEEGRVSRLFEYIEKFPSAEIDRVLEEAFEAFVESGYIGRLVADILKQKIAAACGLRGVNLKDVDFLMEFKRMDESKKRCLMVTICNDACKLGVIAESSAYSFLAEQLRKEPAGIKAEPGAENNPANEREKDNVKKKKTHD